MVGSSHFRSILLRADRMGRVRWPRNPPMESPTGLDKHKWKDRRGSCTADGKFARGLCRAALRPWTALVGGALSQLEVAQALFILLQRINAEAGGEILCKGY